MLCTRHYLTTVLCARALAFGLRRSRGSQSVKRFLRSIWLDIFNIYQYLLCYEIITTTGTSNSFIMSRAQPRQTGAIHFYSCCLWISVDRGAVVTYGEVSINKLRLTSFIKMLLYRIYTTIGDACVCLQNLTNFCPYALISTPNVP